MYPGLYEKRRRSCHCVAQYLGIIPQVVGITVGAIILQALRGMPNHFGYTVLFLVTIVYFILGTLIIRGVKGVK